MSRESAREESAESEAGAIDTDTDTDSDPEGNQADGDLRNEALHQTGATESGRASFFTRSEFHPAVRPPLAPEDSRFRR